MSLAISQDINILEPDKIKIYRDELKNLKLKIEGWDHAPIVKPLIAFPLSDSEHFISFYYNEDGDRKQEKEIGILEGYNKLDPGSKKALKEEIDKLYFIPKITKIHQIDEEYGVTTWVVDTDRGKRTFDVRRRNDVRNMSNDRLIIKDADGNRYEVPDVTNLDKKSQLILKTEI